MKPIAQRKRCEPQIQNRDGDQRTAERHAIVKHEGDDAAVRDRAELLGGHAEEGHVVRKELPGKRQEHGERARERQRERRQRQQRTPVGDERGQEVRIIALVHGAEILPSAAWHRWPRSSRRASPAR
jgi:hypothetical protein